MQRLLGYTRTKNTLNKHAKVGSTGYTKLDLYVVHVHVVGKAMKAQAIKLARGHKSPLYDMVQNNFNKTHHTSQ